MGSNYVNQEVFRTKLALKDFFIDFKNFPARQGRALQMPVAEQKNCLLLRTVQPISLRTLTEFKY